MPFPALRRAALAGAVLLALTTPVAAAAAQVTVDGRIDPAEWAGA